MLAVLDASRYVRIDFDYPDLDVFFLAMENSAIITLNESNFDRELTQDDKPMIVDFWAEWCGPCKMIAPLLDEIAREKAGAVKIAKVNVDENQSLSPSTTFARFRRCFFSRTANCAIRSSASRARRICSAGWKHWLREFSRGENCSDRARCADRTPQRSVPDHVALSSNAPGGGRTHNLWLRRPTLYPVELRAQ